MTTFDGDAMDFRPVSPESNREMRKWLFEPFVKHREDCLELHIDRLWNQLPEQSKRRLGVLAASVGVDVDDGAHANLVCALSLIAEAEGTLDEEEEFASLYLTDEAVCEAVAEAERLRAEATEEGKARRRENNRLAVAKFRQKQRAAEGRQAEKRRIRNEERLEKTLERKAIAVDGEGVTLEDGSHLYRYMAASTSNGTVLGELYDEEGISSYAALEFLSGLPKTDEDGVPYLGIFGYGLGYDVTKWLEKLKNKHLYELTHSSDLVPKAKCGNYRLVMVGKCLQLLDRKAPKGLKKTLVWDILKGFQSTFVKALIAWGVGTKEEWDRILDMKKKRGTFATESWSDVTRYCKDECRLLAELVEKYVRAHVDAGIDLAGKYHGAGSTSDAFLKLMNALDKKCTRECESEDLEAFNVSKSAFSRAFFGGRAEVSRLGIIRGPIWQADIASAYPHALFLMPCVRHGKWRHVSAKGVGRALDGARMACVHYKVDLGWSEYAKDQKRQKRPELTPPDAAGKKKRRKKDLADLSELEKTINERQSLMKIRGDVSTLPWGPLPYRTESGSIVFPAQHPGGWAWQPEYEVARDHFEGVKALEAWVLRSECQCERPYFAIAQYYLQRLAWGGNKGKVLKLGMNGCYGKFAQTVGSNPKYSCRVVAGYITASTRGRMIEAIVRGTSEPWDVIYAATDGLLSTKPLTPPDPSENETTEETKRISPDKGWLGSWEVDSYPDSIFVVQPGFYFSMEPKGKARTRGTPLEVIDEYRTQIVEQWKRDPTRKPKGLPKQDVFHGIKTTVRPPTKANAGYRRKASYGRWSKEDRKINYVVSPKRADLVDLGDGSYRLHGWWLHPDEKESAEYKKDPSFGEMQAAKEDQPDFVEPLLQGVGKDD